MKTSEIVNMCDIIRIQFKISKFRHVTQEGDIGSTDIVFSQMDTG